MVPLPSLSSPVSLGFPVCYKRLIAIIRSEMGFLSDSLPLLKPLICCCCCLGHSVLESPGKDRWSSQWHLFWQGVSQQFCCWLGEKAISQQELISGFQLCQCKESLCYQQPSGPEGCNGNFRSVPSLLLSTQLIVQCHRVG